MNLWLFVLLLSINKTSPLPCADSGEGWPLIPWGGLWLLFLCLTKHPFGPRCSCPAAQQPCDQSGQKTHSSPFQQHLSYNSVFALYFVLFKNYYKAIVIILNYVKLLHWKVIHAHDSKNADHLQERTEDSYFLRTTDPRSPEATTTCPPRPPLHLLSHWWKQAQLRDQPVCKFPVFHHFPPFLLHTNQAGLHIFPPVNTARPQLGPLHLLLLLGTLFHQIFAQFFPSCHPCLCSNFTSQRNLWLPYQKHHPHHSPSHYCVNFLHSTYQQFSLGSSALNVFIIYPLD